MAYYRVFAQPTLTDYQRFLSQQNSDGSYQGAGYGTFDEWVASGGRGKLLRNTSSKNTAKALAKKTGGILDFQGDKRGGIGGALYGMGSRIGGGLSDLIDEPGVQALLLAGAGGAAMGAYGGAAGGAGAGTGAGAGLAEEAAMLGVGDATAGSAAAGTIGGGGLAAGGPLMPPAIPTAELSASQMWGPIPLGPGASGAGVAGATYGATPGVSTTPTAAGGAGVGAATTGSKIVGALTSPTALGAMGGALIGGMGGAEQSGTYKVEEGLPDWLMPYAKPTLDRYASELQNYNVDPYGVLPGAMQEFQKTISGQYLDPSTNKYLEDYFRLGAERIKGSLSPSFGFMQAFGGHSGYNEALARGLGDFSVGLYGGNYAKERDRQTQMTASAPSFLANTSTAAFAPYQQYLSTIGNLGKKKEQPFFDNQFSNILGGAMVGGSLGNLFSK